MCNYMPVSSENLNSWEVRGGAGGAGAREGRKTSLWEANPTVSSIHSQLHCALLLSLKHAVHFFFFMWGPTSSDSRGGSLPGPGSVIEASNQATQCESRA